MVRLIAALLFTLLVTSSTRSVAATPQLTPAEISAGWILLFDGETDFGWLPTGDARWSVKNGEITADPGGVGMLATTTEFADYEIKAEFWVDAKANSGLFLRAPTEGEIKAETSYEVNVNDANTKWPTGSIFEVGKPKEKITSVGKWTSFDVTVKGDKLTVVVDGKRVVDAKDSKYKRGVIALQYDGDGVLRVRNIRLRPLSQESIFNGKDLTGWKEVPDHKSVFTVTPQGWLNVKNGNGDIQTAKTWGDFVLQLEIFSNGDHLNSGVFFRANEGKFWSGYEAQIRNQWEGEDRAKAVDYGTGGIYNRQPARKVVSSDREWFTMTVAAAGKHMATWVNGYQVTDFTDLRPVNQSNAREGARTAPGVLSIQGHDPTTDLSFRNIRIAELTK